MLRLERIAKIYPNNEVLKDVTWEVKPGQRIGLVGVNGAGKTTQLKIVAGEIEPTAGQVVRPASLNIAYLTQEFEGELDRCVRDEFWTVFAEANENQQQQKVIQKRLETITPDDAEELEKLLKKMDRLQREFEGMDGYALESQIEKMMPEVGFAPGDGDRLISEFSGGWQMRISLGKVLLQEPDILLLDEPTNHLDLKTIEWLETYLKGLKQPMVIVSHDRHFLDRLCTHIVETERGVSSTYVGNYSRYLAQKEEAAAAQVSAFDRQQKELAQQQAFVDKFRASATRSTQAKSREKQLAKIDRIDAPQSQLKSLQFRFPPAPRSGRMVVEISDLTHGYGDDLLYLGAALEVERGERVAFLGPNGCGKSSLLRLIVGEEEPMDGAIALGHNVLPSYFAQNQADALDLTKTVMNTIHDEAPHLKDEEVRTMLGQFLFSNDTVFKPVEALSGGEKGRLALAKMLLRKANLLVLDEPTNHLDIPAKETLENALKHYDGTVLVVSHDRYFIRQVATKVVDIRDGEFRIYAGYDEYYEKTHAKPKQKKSKLAAGKGKRR
ncbi:ABC-F family ATP-binding cassette domain-containing protein [Synechococcus sp. PCC 7336]|uniref:ABC-F family ATP-binding cassette domain-containing protein n=1 Tax=Synechococcus sp. PCC 7336 TaxID=195250 RepID=UPI000348689D|nr:ABC-F family ATP-binding cassette domain-containing protein [Synechococcus sp. PCC 7336]